ncbi:hypothetical protein SapgrDRAFT_0495 [Saprospira grandis DSM 2844]|uniref:Uncharacterized protein n=1 Tax=Saprospira grandis DSM 2844 TaxID=694433 RepID=J0NXL2_9BACT|nr:hypothetical protein [Saprospira grandis]EJF52239.1 hypothetical protein SapgrDRAFT_0495 [Saprospira grandis DSM 2844]
MALLIALLFFLGPAASKLAAAMLRGSQVCSALRGLCPLGLACGHPSAALGLPDAQIKRPALCRALAKLVHS